VRDAALRVARPYPAGHLADADEARAHHRVGSERSTRGVDRGVAVEADCLGEHQLFVTELRVQLGDVDGAVGDSRGQGCGSGRLRLGEVAHTEAGRLDAVLDTSDPRRPLAYRARQIARRDHDGDGRVLMERLIGASISRVEDPRILCGLGNFIDDVQLPGLLFAAFCRSPHPHARITGFDVAAQNRVDEAIRQFEASLPGTDSVGDLVQLHQRRGDLQKYKAEVERLAAQYPSNPDLQAELGQVYEAMHQPYQAVVYFRRALDSDPNSLTALNGLGLSLMDMHDYPSAIAEFQKCLRIENSSFQCLDNIGAAQLEDGKFAAAQTSLQHANKVAPERPEPLVNFGYLADTLGDWKKAVAYYAQAIALWPYSREAYVDIGIAYEKHGLYPLAQAALIKGIAAAPDDGRLHVLLGEAYEAQGERDKAIAQYKAAENSSDPEVVRISHASIAKMTNGGGNPQ